MQPTLPDLAETILSAHRAAANADRLASIAIRVFLKKRLEAATALSRARGMMDPSEFLSWLDGLGIEREEAEATLAERWTQLVGQGRQHLARPVLAAQARNRNIPPVLDRGFDRR
jgi:hypothetical protein